MRKRPDIDRSCLAFFHRHREFPERADFSGSADWFRAGLGLAMDTDSIEMQILRHCRWTKPIHLRIVERVSWTDSRLLPRRLSHPVSPASVDVLHPRGRNDSPCLQRRGFVSLIPRVLRCNAVLTDEPRAEVGKWLSFSFLSLMVRLGVFKCRQRGQCPPHCGSERYERQVGDLEAGRACEARPR
jgi:hypothetical protein